MSEDRNNTVSYFRNDPTNQRDQIPVPAAPTNPVVNADVKLVLSSL